MEKDENISFFICDENNNDTIIQEENGFLFNDNDTYTNDDIYNHFNDSNIYNIFDSDVQLSRNINYETNFTVKELMLIADYYGLSKELKNSKANKLDIINAIVNFECNPINYDKVITREKMWFYINELKNDKHMKKYILW